MRGETLFHLFELSTPLIMKAPLLFKNAQREKEIRSIVAL